MKTLRTKIAFGVAALIVAAASLGFSPADDAIARKVNEYEGQHIAKKGSFDITEVDGQPIALAGDPSQWG